MGEQNLLNRSNNVIFKFNKIYQKIIKDDQI